MLLSTRMLLIEAEINMALAENTLFMINLEAGRLPVPKLGTAAALVLLAEDGWATDKQWKRARQYANRHGMNLSVS